VSVSGGSWERAIKVHIPLTDFTSREVGNASAISFGYPGFCEEVFTAEAQSSQRSENFLFKNSFTLRPPRLGLENCG
jgi:hypothetical protein